jgi:hypothetical protein
MNPAEWDNHTVRASINVSQLDAMIKRSAEAWAAHDEQKAISSKLYKEAEALDEKILITLKDSGKSKYFVDGVGTMSIVSKFCVKVPSSVEAKKAFFAHLKARGETLLYAMLTVNSNTLNAWYNAELDTAEELGRAKGFLVPGIDQPTNRESLRLTRDTKGKKK